MRRVGGRYQLQGLLGEGGMALVYAATDEQTGQPVALKVLRRTARHHVAWLEAEAAGMRATGIGCFFVVPVHPVFGLEGLAFQSLYHFTVGGPVDDPRLIVGQVKVRPEPSTTPR